MATTNKSIAIDHEFQSMRRRRRRREGTQTPRRRRSSGGGRGRMPATSGGRNRRTDKKKPVNVGGGQFGPRDTTSFLMRAKRAGGIAPPEQLVVDSYGTTKGLIRLKLEPDDSGESEVEVERRLGQDVGRFEMARRTRSGTGWTTRSCTWRGWRRRTRRSGVGFR